MAVIIPDLFGSYITGRRTAEQDNWTDIDNYNNAIKKQIDNQFAQDTYSAKVADTNNKAYINYLDYGVRERGQQGLLDYADMTNSRYDWVSKHPFASWTPWNTSDATSFATKAAQRYGGGSGAGSSASSLYGPNALSSILNGTGNASLANNNRVNSSNPNNINGIQVDTRNAYPSSGTPAVKLVEQPLTSADGNFASPVVVPETRTPTVSNSLAQHISFVPDSVDARKVSGAYAAVKRRSNNKTGGLLTNAEMGEALDLLGVSPGSPEYEATVKYLQTLGNGGL